MNKMVEHSKSDLVGRVFESDGRIRYCVVVDDGGNVLAGGMRPGVESFEPQRETAKLHLQGVIHKGMVTGWDNYLGEVDYVVVRRKKVVLIIFPLPNSKDLFVSAQPDYPLDQVTLLREIVRTSVA